MSTTAPGPPGSAGLQSAQGYSPQTFDTTGQVAPPGMKPRVTATLWEDEGSLCFQVEAEGVCVARREDNHMINGTKLLNVAGMTRGRRDGILKSEKTRHVVKIGPMHLKGVWIPFERALDFANKEKITEKLYPLFVHDIGALLYHPSNQPRGVANVAMAAAERRRNEQQQQQQQYMRNPQVPTTPATTPPGNSMPASMQQYPTTQAYDSTRQLYSAPSQPAQYDSQPPMPREQDTTQDHEQHEYKQEPEYAHSGAQYSSNRGTYPYSATSAAAPLQNEHISPEMTGSPSHPNGSGRATPRTAAAPPHWSGGYSTPQRSNQPPPSSNLYNVMSNDTRSAPNGASAGDYASQGGYGASAYQTPNGATPSTKRVRELDDDGADDYARAGNRDAIDGLKRRKTIDEGGAVGPYPPQRIQQRR
ncbi:MAG: hypothetical protein Q9165_002310 [Trypethelium subeluteriae]